MRHDTTSWGSGKDSPLGVVSCLSDSKYPLPRVKPASNDMHTDLDCSPGAHTVPNKGDSIMTITVYSKPNCVQCTATYRALDKQGATYSTVDISTDPEALDYVRSLGHAQAPVVVAGDLNWAGFRPDLIKQAVSQLAVANG